MSRSFRGFFCSRERSCMEPTRRRTLFRSILHEKKDRKHREVDYSKRSFKSWNPIGRLPMIKPAYYCDNRPIQILLKCFPFRRQEDASYGAGSKNYKITLYCCCSYWDSVSDGMKYDVYKGPAEIQENNSSRQWYEKDVSLGFIFVVAVIDVAVLALCESYSWWGYDS